MVKTPVNPQVLKWARESANLTKDEVACRVKKSVDVIEAWESGIDAPYYGQLEKLAYEIYKRPIALFFFPKPPQEDDAKRSFRTLSEVEYNNLPSMLIRQIRKAKVKQENLYELCNGKNPSPKQLFRDFKILQSYDFKELSHAIRDYLKISFQEQKSWDSEETALENWRSAFEESGIFVFKDAFKHDGYSGFCLYDNVFPIIIINNSMPKTRQVFTLFHELGHLLFETSGIDKIDNDYIDMLPEQDRQVEILCNRLAAEILVPAEDFDIYINGIQVVNEDTVSSLANTYKVSREVVLRKFLDRSLVNESTYKKLTAKWIDEAKRKRQERKSGGDYYNTQGTYLGNKYLEIAFKEYYRRVISEVQLANYLNIKIDSLHSFETALHKRWAR
jgi:Zn-dependent peptidase ImmA (M78 family)